MWFAEALSYAYSGAGCRSRRQDRDLSYSLSLSLSSLISPASLPPSLPPRFVSPLNASCTARMSRNTNLVTIYAREDSRGAGARLALKTPSDGGLAVRGRAARIWGNSGGGSSEGLSTLPSVASSSDHFDLVGGFAVSTDRKGLINRCCPMFNYHQTKYQD